MNSTASLPPNTCPEWCNTTHVPGSNPRRQTHRHRFYPSEKGSSGVGRGMPMWVSTHPCPDRNGISPPCFLMRVTAYGEQAYFVLSLNDTRALIADLTEQADRLAAEQALIDAETVYGATA